MAHLDSNRVRPLLLVHGAWHGAWCWSALQAELDRRAVPSHAIDLPGHGTSVASFGGLYDDADRVRAALDTLGRRPGYAEAGIVLVGHSYGGAVITQAALASPEGDAGREVRDDLAHLVYIAAFAPNEGESVASAMRSGTPAASSAGAADARQNLLSAAVVPQPDGSTTLHPDLAAEVLYGDCAPAEVTSAIRRLCPQPGATMSEPVLGSPRRAVPSSYIRCLRDRAVDPALQARMAARCNASIDLDTDHSPFMSRTKELAEILERIAREPT
jgi:pimeloyl-ACP methyl ester carboxylesterase